MDCMTAATQYGEDEQMLQKSHLATDAGRPSACRENKQSMRTHTLSHSCTLHVRNIAHHNEDLLFRMRGDQKKKMNGENAAAGKVHSMTLMLTDTTQSGRYPSRLHNTNGILQFTNFLGGPNGKGFRLGDFRAATMI